MRISQTLRDFLTNNGAALILGVGAMFIMFQDVQNLKAQSTINAQYHQEVDILKERVSHNTKNIQGVTRAAREISDVNHAAAIERERLSVTLERTVKILDQVSERVYKR